MTLNTYSPLKVFLFGICLILSFSCSKDSDLFSEYVLADSEKDIENRADGSDEDEESSSEEGEESTSEGEEVSTTWNGNLPTSGANVFYVTANGDGNNDGKSEATAWNLQQAFKMAKAGDYIHIKAGQYSNFNIIQNNNGTSSNPIKFIGYKNTPGDIDPYAQSTFTLGTQTINVMNSFSYGDNLDASEMPLIRENRSGASGSGEAFTINGDYVVLMNIQVQYYRNGLRWFGNNGEYANIICSEQGNFESTGGTAPAYEGTGIYHYGDNCSIKNIYIANSGAQGFTVKANNNTIDAVTVTSDNDKNNTDYFFLFQEGHDNTATNIYVKRIGNSEQDGKPHYGHGICYKTPEPCYNNNVDGFIAENTNLEIQFPGVHDNTVKNGYIVRPMSTSSVTAAGIRLANGARDCTLSNIFIENSTIHFADWDDGLGGDIADSADGFVFNQIIVNGGKSAVSFNYYDGHQTGDWSGSADDNTFYNCTFYNTEFQFETSRPNSNTQFINCIFSDIEKDTFKTGNSQDFSVDASYLNSNFYKTNFSVPTSKDISTMNPQFRDVNNYDFGLKSGSALRGVGVATPFLNAGNHLGAVQD